MEWPDPVYIPETPFTLQVMKALTVDIRTATASDAEALAHVHDAAWQLAYRGIIPAMHLERMVQKRGASWWAGAANRSRGGILVLDVGRTVAGYATIGQARAGRYHIGGPWDGEIYELYIAPDYQGLGFGSRLFRRAREKLSQTGRARTVVWALADNDPAIAFYRRRGGELVGRGQERFGATSLPKLAFGFEG